MTEFRLEVTLSILAPIISSSCAAGELGFDLLFGRDHTGVPYIPGSHIKGRLLEALRDLKGVLNLDEAELTRWFGEESPPMTMNESEASDEPARGRLRFGDFSGPVPEASSLRNRISIDQERGAVKKGHLLSIEVAYPVGKTVSFRGHVRFLAEKSEAERIRSAVESGLRWIPALGGQRSAGFGHLTGTVSVSLSTVNRSKLTRKIPGDTLEIALEMDGPFCVSKRRVADNLFESESIIPGSAIKGALATTLNQLVGRPLAQPIDGSLPEPWAMLGSQYSKLHFTHAFPCPKERKQRPKVIPLSLLPASEGEWIDAAFCDGPVLIRGRAPSFNIDWKQDVWAAAKKDFGWGPEPHRQLRVRTAIESKARRAKKGSLFAYEMVEPNHHLWRGRVTLPPDAGDEMRERLCELLEAGLTHLGKTKAGGQVVSIRPWEPPEIRKDTSQWVVTLQTPGLLLESDPALNRSLLGEDTLQRAYGLYWSTASGQTLELVRFFAAQSLAGGGYLMRRFRQGKPWQPFLLTSAGSTFVLKSIDQTKARGHLLNWSRRGLPLAEAFGADSWRTCPFVPENGFGEIAVKAIAEGQQNQPDLENS